LPPELKENLHLNKYPEFLDVTGFISNPGELLMAPARLYIWSFNGDAIKQFLP